MSLIGFLLMQTATIQPFKRYANGEDYYGEPEERPCRLQRTRDLEHTYKNPAGGMDQVLARAKMFCEGEPIPERSKVTVDGAEYIVLECYRAFGFEEDHLEVVLQ
ncbi:MAG: hypothetical protein E7327_08880 [Clostridiales bacterium]|nr:hypothetical protein [Clostridiales bacterium]